MAALKTVEAGEVRDGDFIPGLDNAYVIDVETDPDVRDGQYNTRLGDEDFVAITFNDAQGGEGYLLVPSDMPVTVRREED